ncbi:MAG: hypothetical protein LUG60_04090 [Erysipelotrichaceae bacterium]|nr:hypothetical protein [Erysipelotrichaceae bacterium]
MIYRISIGIDLDFVDVSIMIEDDIEHIVYSEASQIHVFVEDSILYSLVIDKLHYIYKHTKIITFSFNNSVNCDYMLTKKIHMKHYTLPDRYQLDKQIQSNLAYKLNQYHVTFNEIEDFMTYLGIDQKHLRENLSYENQYGNLSLGEYNWKNVFGKQPTIDLLKYLQESEEHIQNYFTNKQETIIHRFIDIIDVVLRKYFNQYTYIYILNPNNPYSLYQLISQTSQINNQNLLNLNKETYQQFKEKYQSTKNAKRPFSHKEDKLDDLLQTLDIYISQRYEIHRFQSMQAIYDQILAYFNEIKITYPKDAYDYHIPIDFYDDFISSFIDTRDFYSFRTFVDYPYIYQQLFQKYDYQIIMSRYDLYHGIICEDMLENECDIYY